MLYIVLLENLLAELDYEKKQKLISLVFKKTAGFAYFKRIKDMSLSKVENVADYRRILLDYFRVVSFSKANNVAGNNNYVGEYFYKD